MSRKKKARGARPRYATDPRPQEQAAQPAPREDRAAPERTVLPRVGSLDPDQQKIAERNQRHAKPVTRRRETWKEPPKVRIIRAFGVGRVGQTITPTGAHRDYLIRRGYVEPVEG